MRTLVAFPIPTGGGISPAIGVVFAIVAAVAFVVILFQAVRYFRNSGDRHDQFGPPLDDPPLKDPPLKDPKDKKPGDDLDR